MKDIISRIGASSGLILGLSINSYVCKVSDCTFFLSSTLIISALLVLVNLGYLMNTKAKMTLVSVYIGLANALIDIIIIFVYTKVLRCNSLFFCLTFLIYQMIISITTCFMPLTSSIFLIIICILFIHPIFELEFVERNGFGASQAPKVIWSYITNIDTTIPFVPAIGFKVLLTEFSRRVENGGFSGLFNSTILFFMGAMLAFFDVPAFNEELEKIGPVIAPFLASQVLFAGFIFILKLNQEVNLISIYPSACALFIAMCLVFCSRLLPWFWQKTVIEEALSESYMFLLFAFVPFVLYVASAYGNIISPRFSRESFIAGIFTSL